MDRLVQLMGLLCKYSALHEVQPILLGCWNAFQASGETVLLDAYLANAQKWVRFRESLAQLSSDDPTQQVAAVKPARAFSSPSRHANNLEAHAAGVTSCQDREYCADPYISCFGVSKEEFESDFRAWLKANSSSTKRYPYVHQAPNLSSSMHQIPPVGLLQDKKHTVNPTISYPEKQHVAQDKIFTKRKQYSTGSLDPCTVEYQKKLEHGFLAGSGPHFSSQRSFGTVSQPPIYQR